MRTTIKKRIGNLAKQCLSAHPRVYFALRQSIKGKEPWPATETITELLRTHFPATQSVFFVQIGSNDGLQGDPLNELILSRDNWSGLFVEPIQFVFDRLKANYGESSRFIFENVAISDKAEKKPFYYVSENAKKDLGESVPWWHDQLASFDRQHITKHLNGALEPYIETLQLDCIPIPELLARNNIEKIDVIHIDTEGYDYHVLKQINLDRHQPKVVIYEHKHLAEADKQKAEQLMRSFGYRIQITGSDTIAIKP